MQEKSGEKFGGAPPQTEYANSSSIRSRLPSTPQRRPLLVNERNMMLDVLRNTREKLLQCQPPSFGMNTNALPIGIRQRTKNSRDMTATQFDEPQLFFEI